MHTPHFCIPILFRTRAVCRKKGCCIRLQTQELLEDIYRTTIHSGRSELKKATGNAVIVVVYGSRRGYCSICKKEAAAAARFRPPQDWKKGCTITTRRAPSFPLRSLQSLWSLDLSIDCCHQSHQYLLLENSP